MRFKSIMLLITHGCNLSCSYCYEHKNSHLRMSAKLAKSILSKHIASLDDKYDSFEVQFMGGEPLLNFGLIKEVSDWLWSVQWKKTLLTIYIPTNGTLLTEEMRQWFSVNRGKICLGLSFDGNSIMQNLNRSSSASLIDTTFFATTWPDQSVKLTISPKTVDKLYDGVCALWNYGFKTVSADLAMGDIAWERHHLVVFRKELRKFVNRSVQNFDTDHVFTMMNLPILSLLDKDHKYSGKQCYCGEDLVCVDVDGQEYPCHLFSPVSISNKEQLTHLRGMAFNDYDAFNMNPCCNCFLNPICTAHCYGMNYKTYGSISINSPFHCNAFKLQFAENCRLKYKIAMKNQDMNIQNKVEQIIKNIQL